MCSDGELVLTLAFDFISLFDTIYDKVGLARLLSFSTGCAATDLFKCLLVIIHTDHRLLPLSRWDSALVHDVDLAVGTALHLRQQEVCRDQTAQSGEAPNKAAFAPNCTSLATIREHDIQINLRSPPVGFSMYAAKKMQGNSTM